MSTAEAKTEPTRHPPDIVEAAHVVLDPRCDSLRLALAVKRLNEGTGWVILGRHETLLEASARVLRDALACAEAALAKIKEEKIGGHHLCEKGHGWVVDGQPCYLCQHANAVALSEERDKFAGLFATERERREKAEADLVATRLLLEDSELGCGRLNESARIGWSGALRLRDTRNRLIGELTEAREDTELLDWLESNGKPETYEDAPHATVWCIIGDPDEHDLRKSIRAAREAGKGQP